MKKAVKNLSWNEEAKEFFHNSIIKYNYDPEEDVFWFVTDKKDLTEKGKFIAEFGVLNGYLLKHNKGLVYNIKKHLEINIKK